VARRSTLPSWYRAMTGLEAWPGTRRPWRRPLGHDSSEKKSARGGSESPRRIGRRGARRHHAPAPSASVSTRVGGHPCRISRSTAWGDPGTRAGLSPRRFSPNPDTARGRWAATMGVVSGILSSRGDGPPGRGRMGEDRNCRRPRRDDDHLKAIHRHASGGPGRPGRTRRVPWSGSTETAASECGTTGWRHYNDGNVTTSRGDGQAMLGGSRTTTRRRRAALAGRIRE
jgi:hypothetical protein